jgi:calcium-dependent protein kinase
LNEVGILKSLDHPNVIKLFEFYSDSDYYYIITGIFYILNISKEYWESGDLFDFLR